MPPCPSPLLQGDTFTLESLVNMRMDQYAEFIAEMSVNASKELAIETAITSISAVWAELKLDMVRRTCSAHAAFLLPFCALCHACSLAV